MTLHTCFGESTRSDDEISHVQITSRNQDLANAIATKAQNNEVALFDLPS